MNAGERYLRLASSYCDFLGGLRWSADEDALEFHDGRTFAFNEEIATFIEGFCSHGQLIHLAFVLHLLYLLRNATDSSGPVGRRFKQAYARAGKSLRNAGVFGAALCRNIPPAVGPFEPREVLERLRDPTRPMRWFLANFHDTFYPVEAPPWGPAMFEGEIVNLVNAYTDEELLSWFRHGRGPVKETGMALAIALPTPRTLSGALAALLERPRLAGARPFVSQMLSTLSLPPRRDLRPQAALGGYSEVVTTGQPHHLLLSQFALDEWDFLRRYADRELLYFRREDPHVHTRQELIVLVDQGVRTWGDIRLVLAAAVLALGRQAARGKLPFFLSSTSRDGEVVDPVDVENEAFAEMVEGSDLSANPGLALERLLERPAEGMRDVVLLTHPRALAEEDVRAAALRTDPATRLLALTLNERGEAALSEIRHGVPVPIRQFKVDFDAAPPPPVAVETAPQQWDWQGDVEPIPMPFRFGVTKPVLKFDFTHDGKWLITVGADGVCHAWSTDGKNEMRVLPRPMLKGKLVSVTEWIIGVAGGFVLVGRNAGRLVAVHYDLENQVCKARDLDQAGEDISTVLYSAEHHTIVIRTSKRGSECAVDLATGACFPGDSCSGSSRAQQAWYAAARHQLPAPFIPWAPNHGMAAAKSLGTYCPTDPVTGQLTPVGLQPAWQPFIPMADGKPRLRGCVLTRAVARGNILAVQNLTGSQGSLHLFRGPTGIPLAEYPSKGSRGFTLSSDGKLLARQVRRSQVEVRATEGDTTPLAMSHAGGRSKHLSMMLGNHWVFLRTGREKCFRLVRWDGGRLKIENSLASPGRFTSMKLPQELEPPILHAWTTCIPDKLKYDRKRFITGATTTVTAVLDCYGQVVMLDAAQKTVCMFFVCGNEFSCWLPDGTSFGPASPSRRAPTEADLNKVGQALAKASAQGRSLQCK
jgi:hypothetical protein